MLAVLLPDEEVARGVESFLHVDDAPSAVEMSAQENRDSSPGRLYTEENKHSSSSETERSMADGSRREVDFSLIGFEQTRTRILDMLASHASRWNGSLGTIRATRWMSKVL